jgi:hypothetical protein
MSPKQAKFPCKYLPPHYKLDSLLAKGVSMCHQVKTWYCHLNKLLSGLFIFPGLPAA